MAVTRLAHSGGDPHQLRTGGAAPYRTERTTEVPCGAVRGSVDNRLWRTALCGSTAGRTGWVDSGQDRVGRQRAGPGGSAAGRTGWVGSWQHRVDRQQAGPGGSAAGRTGWLGSWQDRVTWQRAGPGNSAAGRTWWLDSGQDRVGRQWAGPGGLAAGRTGWEGVPQWSLVTAGPCRHPRHRPSGSQENSQENSQVGPADIEHCTGRTAPPRR